MCGICGFAGFEDAELLRRMTTSLVHRGPDSEGYFTSPEASLGFRRLSIIDLETGDQPLTNEDASLQVVLNGEIYNYRELRQELERRGHRFASRSDTEVLVHLYEEKGLALLERLQGMFAFALWDAKQRRLLLARDRLGIKPLYYTQQEGRLLFASEAKALLRDPTIPRRLNSRAVDSLLHYLYLPGPETLLEGIQRVPPGSWLIWEGGQVQMGRYWQPCLQKTRPVSEGEAAAEFRRHFEEAVRSHLVSDVPVGAFLSGGLDSAGVVAQMARLLGRPPKSFTIGFAGAEDERPRARRLADHFRTEHHELELQPERFAQDLPRILWHLEEPTPISFLPLFYLSEFARQNVKAVLIGEGADELFAGYRRVLPMAPVLRFLPSRLQTWLFDIGLHSLPTHFRANGRRQQARSEAAIPLGLGSTKDSTPLSAVLDFEQRYELPDYQLHRVDRMTMAWGLEARVPYLDHRLVEFVNSLPDSLKLHGLQRKYLLRKALAGLVPEEVLRGGKRGFGAPFRLWYSGGFREAAARYLSEEQVRRRGLFRSEAVQALFRPHRWGWLERRRGSQLFLLLTVEIYCRLFVDPPTIEEFATLPSL